MASFVRSLRGANGRLDWLSQWLRDELKFYPGRVLLVARMVTAATLVTIICMTFRIPFAAQGAIYALLVSRESPRSTLQSAATIFLVTASGAAYLLVSMRLVINFPPLHFLWIIGTFFLAFYAISAQTNYLAATAFVFTISTGIPLWDRHVSAEINVEDTLWLCLATLIGIVVTAGVELAFVRLRPGDEVVLPIAERLSALENVLICYAEVRAVDSATEQNVIRLEMLGTSMLRRNLRRSDHSLRYSAMMGGVAVLVGRLVDLAAALTQLGFEPSASDQRRFRNLASAVTSIRNDLMSGKIPVPVQFNPEEESASGIALLAEMQVTVTLIPQVFTGSRSIHEHLPSADDIPRPALFAPDALVNPDHVHFALKGCLAASSCYVIYNAIAWPGISTAVTTCLLTALSTIGASRQKQMLRVTGAIAGGILIGMGSQLFIMPYLDSIAGFVVLFVLVTAVSSWFMTSSPRLSYFGMQLALAFYLINLQEFAMQTSLSIARDRVVGILLGLLMMWLVFDQLWSAPAGVGMKKALGAILRLLAQLAREPVSNDFRTAIERTYSLRETIHAQLDKVRSLADGVLFEFGPSRHRDIELRSYIREWQPQLRTLFVLRIASLRYRLQLPGFELPETVRLRQQAYDEHSARMLEDMADWIEHSASPATNGIDDSHELLKETLHGIQAEEGPQLPTGRAQSLISLLRCIGSLTTSLTSEIAAEFGGLRAHSNL